MKSRSNVKVTRLKFRYDVEVRITMNAQMKYENPSPLVEKKTMAKAEVIDK